MNGNMLKQPRGLTMVEVVIAIAILSTAIVGVFNVFVNAQRAATIAREESLAQTAINETIAKLRSQFFRDIPTFLGLKTYSTNTERFYPKVQNVDVAGDKLPRGLKVSLTSFPGGIPIGANPIRYYGPGPGVGEMRIILVNDEDPVESELGETDGDKDGVDLNHDGSISTQPFSAVTPATDYSVYADTGAARMFPRKLSNGTDPSMPMWSTPTHRYANLGELEVLPVIVQVRWWSDAGVPREITVITFLTNRSGTTG